MISYEEALKIVIGAADLTGNETVPLIESAGRVLAGDIRSDIDMPPFNKSAMDGFAVRTEDLRAGASLRIIETIPAGVYPKKSVGKGECSRIMTGGAVPDGAGRVVMVEHTEEADGHMTVTKESSAVNICFRAEDIRTGDLVLEKGTIIDPPRVALLASVGCDPVEVFRRPVMGIAATGSELVEPDEKPEGAMIRNSNGYQLFSQAARAGFDPRYLGIVGDTPEAVGEIIERVSGGVDLLIFSGGVSMGDYDFVPGVLREKGFELYFEKVAVKPGRPMVFGRRGKTAVFGLPGNPVSTFILFELFVKPLGFAMMGSKYRHREVRAVLAGAITRRKTGRRSHIPVRFVSPGVVGPVEYHGSAHIRAFAAADGIIAIETGVSRVEAGEEIDVILTC
ncbi:MAG: molybdopterin molybdotransferase MoeA [Candidatus Krumholzibacteriota bacterium]|nr:molybdopterin molybdotransferase MoeA [Candidatus Krumholzibacteriota bacterium]